MRDEKDMSYVFEYDGFHVVSTEELVAVISAHCLLCSATHETRKVTPWSDRNMAKLDLAAAVADTICPNCEESSEFKPKLHHPVPGIVVRANNLEGVRLKFALKKGEASQDAIKAMIDRYEHNIEPAAAVAAAG